MKICFHICFISTCSKIEMTKTQVPSMPVSFFFYICVPKSTCECFTNAWLLKQKNWKKLVLKCHKDHFSQQSTYLMYCGVDELSITYCSILVICMPLTLHAECPIFAFRCRLILLKSFYQLPPSVQILLTLPAVFEGLLINYCDTSCHML